ncbi:MAG: tetratricopeptide repeat protein [Pedosphaera sp.]|nr:tetratricopeptide repeat protein [Pedosphaera sp.]
MRPLDFPDQHLALAAEGWLELGSSADAARELRHLSRAAESHPDVLELRWRLYASQGAWDIALDVARVVSQIDPGRPSGWIHQSFSLHELNRTEEARELLLPLAYRFPKESIIPYNLACYSCRLGNLTEAREWLLRALKLRPYEEFKSMALSDPDLAPLRGYIETL